MGRTEDPPPPPVPPPPRALNELRSLSSLKGYSSGRSYFSAINTKLAEKNKFVTHFVQKSLQKWAKCGFKRVFWWRSEIVRILPVLAMTTAGDSASGSNFIREVVARFSLFYKQNGAF